MLWPQRDRNGELRQDLERQSIGVRIAGIHGVDVTVMIDGADTGDEAVELGVDSGAGVLGDGGGGDESGERCGSGQGKEYHPV
jgi:hypothetical protein